MQAISLHRGTRRRHSPGRETDRSLENSSGRDWGMARLPDVVGGGSEHLWQLSFTHETFAARAEAVSGIVAGCLQMRAEIACLSSSRSKKGTPARTFRPSFFTRGLRDGEP